MSNKARTRLNKVLAHLRQAAQLLDGVSLSDGPAVFDVCRPLHAALLRQVKDLSDCTAPKHPRKKPSP